MVIRWAIKRLAMFMVRLRVEIGNILIEKDEIGRFWVTLDYRKHVLWMFNGIRTYSCEKEPFTVKWLETMSKEDVLYDVGACVGAYSMIGALYCDKVYAFEPAFNNIHPLMMNITKNKFNNILVSNIAVLHSGESRMHLSSDKEGDASHKWDETGYLVKTEALDNLIYEQGYKCPTYLKIDVDGVEDMVINGALKLLKDKRLKTVITELEHSMNDVHETILSSGFREAERFKGEWYDNIIYVR